jgi:hypothetical protein
MLFNIKYTALCVGVAGTLALQSCEDEPMAEVVHGVKENKVYINTASWAPITAPKNTVYFSVTNTPAGALVDNAESVAATFPIHCTLPSAASVQVKLEVDNSLVPEGFSAVPSNVEVTLENATLTIPQGSMISGDSVKVSIATDQLSSLSPGTYLLPLKISSVTNAESSTNMNVAYVMISTTFTNIRSAAAGEMEGSLVDRTGWTGFVSRPLLAGTAGSMFSASTAQYWRVDPGDDTFYFDVDLDGKLEDITGIRLHTNNQNYNIARLRVETSLDGETWTSQGEASPAYGTYQYVKFYQPIEAAHIRVTVLARRHASQVRLALFDLYTDPD